MAALDIAPFIFPGGFGTRPFQPKPTPERFRVAGGGTDILQALELALTDRSIWGASLGLYMAASVMEVTPSQLNVLILSLWGGHIAQLFLFGTM